MKSGRNKFFSKSRDLYFLARDARCIHFFLVGILNTVVGFAFFSILIFMGLHYTLAVFLATVMGVFFNYQTIGRLVFSNRKNHLLRQFIFVYVILYLINILLIKFFFIFCLSYYACGMMALFFVAPLSFYLNKNFVFK
jgi:putative flippase GtrA